MKLQISFDLVDLDKALALAKEVAPYAVILEVGSLLIFKHGTRAVEQFRATFGEHELLVDSKIMDKGRESAQTLIEAGADWVTVMAGAGKGVIHVTSSTVHDLNKKIMIDLSDAPSAGQSALEAKSFGGDALIFQESYDKDQMALFKDKWDMVRGNTELPIYLAGRISRENIDHLLAVKPDGIIIGKAILDAEDPAQEAAFFAEKVNQS